MKKKLLAIFLAVAMIAALAACGQDADNSQNPGNSQNSENTGSPNTEGPGVQGTDEINGYFSFSYSAGDVGQAYRYLHFYNDVGYGAVVYAGAQTGTYSQMGQISFYTVEEKEFSYAVWASREDVTKDADTGEVDTTTATKATAPYTITFTSVANGSVLATCGYDGENLYTGGPDQVSFFPTAGRSDTHNLIIPQDAAGDRMPSAYSGESAIEMFTFYNVENSLYQVIIYHTGEYVNALADRSSRGTVTYADGVYTLSGGGTITVTDTAITYVNGGETVELSTTPVDAAEKTVVIAMESTATSSYGFDAAMKLVCYDDGTCEVLATIQGSDNVLDSGTYTNSSMGIPEAAVLDTAGEVAISVDFTTMVLSADLPAYAESGFDAFTVSASLSGGDPTGPADPAEPEAEVLLSLEGTSHSSYGFDAPIKLALYTDGTCEVIVTVQGSDNVLDSGTYTNSDLGIPNNAALAAAGEVAIPACVQPFQMDQAIGVEIVNAQIIVFAGFCVIGRPPNLELRALNGFASDGIHFLDGQIGFAQIAQLNGGGPVCFQIHRVDGIVGHIAVSGFYFLHGVRAGGEVLQHDEAVLVGKMQFIVAAVDLRDSSSRT